MEDDNENGEGDVGESGGGGSSDESDWRLARIPLGPFGDKIACHHLARSNPGSLDRRMKEGWRQRESFLHDLCCRGLQHNFKYLSQG